MDGWNTIWIVLNVYVEINTNKKKKRRSTKRHPGVTHALHGEGSHKHFYFESKYTLRANVEPYEGELV